jgi:hypothetical protein
VEEEMNKDRNIIIVIGAGLKKVVAMGMLIATLLLFLAGCGGGTAGTEPTAPAAGVDENASTESTAEEATEPEEDAAEPAAGEAEAEPPVEEAAGDEPPAAPSDETTDDAGDLVAGLPSSGIDEESGLEINPLQIPPGVDFIVRGSLISFNLTPQDSPEFLIESPAGIRYRVKSQPVPQIAFTDGTVLLPHQYQRGMLAQATVRQEVDAGVTSVVISEDLILLNDD